MSTHQPVTVEVIDDKKRFWQLCDDEVVLGFTKTFGPCHASTDVIRLIPDELRATRDAINAYLGET